MASVFRPFQRSYNYLFRTAHEKPVIFYSFVLGLIGPVMVAVVPPIREHYGYVPPPPIPASYPLPNRPRQPISGYEDE
ncbi:hypothetical protein BT96DRAFT_993244 [Gymnopus androsaceus JB14]|uniref:NADH-ubiquinone oxidoreductase 9.5 kDa subunit n=1 Tax=Gymnopus androsaceus JB14 TaxID=1447944 RepID=A0A6A4HSC7_9AGAR|nr:hypothetical protein BT96DRAFT_993244 [Gymnopus androsaceus JB14]